MPAPVPSEHVEQVALVNYARRVFEERGLPCLLFAIPNGGRRSPVTAARLKAEGVLKGIPDLMLAVPSGRFHGLFIEMKRARGGKVSEDQAKMHQLLREQGYEVTVCRGAIEARHALNLYLLHGVAEERRKLQAEASNNLTTKGE